MYASCRKALRSLVDHKTGDVKFQGELLRRCFVTSLDPDTSNCRFFEVVAEVICSGESCQLSFGHVVCLGIANLCSPLVETRRLALAALDAVHEKSTGLSGDLFQFDCDVGSAAPNIYLEAQSSLIQHLVDAHPDEAINVFSQCASHLHHMHDVLSSDAFAHVISGISVWVSSINLLVTDNSSWSKEGRVVLYHLLALTLRYLDSHPRQVQALWNRLVDGRHSNGHATVRFLLEQAAKVGSSAYVTCARKVVACLSRTTFGRQTFQELCDVIEPIRMLPTIDHKLAFPDADEADLWADLDALFAEQPKHSLGAGQFALLFLVDMSVPRAWEHTKQLPALLHGIFSHIGHRNPFVREHARKLLFQCLRSWLPGYTELPYSDDLPSLAELRSSLGDLERESGTIFWTEDDSVSRIGEKMTQLCNLAVRWLQPLHPTLADEWGSLSLLWGTTCSIRPIAFRSLQVFRALMPRITQADLAQLLGRLSNTIAAQETNLHPFTVELLLTLSTVAGLENLDTTLLPQLYWCTIACLQTPIEAEFHQLLELLEVVLDRLDLDDPYIAQVLLANKPTDWLDGATGLQPLLLVGLRSIKTLPSTMKVLRRLSDFDDARLIDASGNRLRDMYTLILPWCLRAMEENSMDDLVVGIAQNVHRLAEEEDKPNIARIMLSFIKSRFRTKDDFMRQAAAALREYYAPQCWTEVVSLLLSLVLNQERWLQVKSMQILKVLFQLRETRNPVDRLGSELLMPLLRLLQTDLASQALDVLDEPMTISGGLPAKQVLRMSMHVGPMQRDGDGVTEVFGAPDKSGWSVARPDRQRDACRMNVMAVFDTCKVPTRPSRIDFEPEVDRFSDPLEADLGDLVQNLHELSTFFLGDQDIDHPSSSKVSLPLTSMPTQQLEARVAAILAKSTDSSGTTDSPQTPFVDVFQIDGSDGRGSFDGSDDDSDSSEFDMDTFAFDSAGNLSSEGGHFEFTALKRRQGSL